MITISPDQISSLRKSLHQYIDGVIDSFVESNMKEDDFLEEISKPVEPAPDKTPKPEIPNLEELTDRLDLVPEGKEAINDEQWEKFVKTIVSAGWTAKKLLKNPNVEKFHFTKKQKSILKDLQGLRNLMLAKEMDLDTAISQNYVGEVEKKIITDFALKTNL